MIFLAIVHLGLRQNQDTMNKVVLLKNEFHQQGYKLGVDISKNVYDGVNEYFIAYIV